jgi:hypothetical protein
MARHTQFPFFVFFLTAMLYHKVRFKRENIINACGQSSRAPVTTHTCRAVNHFPIQNCVGITKEEFHFPVTIAIYDTVNSSVNKIETIR